MIEQTDLSDRDVRLDYNEAYNVHGADSKARLQGVPELTNSLFTLSVGDRGFRSRL